MYEHFFKIFSLLLCGQAHSFFFFLIFHLSMCSFYITHYSQSALDTTKIKLIIGTIVSELANFLREPNKSTKYKQEYLQKTISVISKNSLKISERYEKCLRISSSVKGKSLPAPPSGREWVES